MQLPKAECSAKGSVGATPAPRKVLISGASGGIGYAAARRFARNGDALFLHAFSNAQRLVDLRREFQNVDIQILSGDLRDSSFQDLWACEAWNWRETGADVLILAAGIDILTGARKLWTYEEKLCALWELDVLANIRLARNLGSKMHGEVPNRAARPAIFFIGWDAIEWGMSGDSAELFATAKGALTAFARCFAQKIAPQVRVNCLAPGWIETAWGESAPEYWKKRACDESLANRWGTPEDVAEAAFFLASPQADFLNAVILPIDGGRRFG